MKSPMIEAASYISHKEGYSDLQVLKSNAGYYIGTIYTGHDGFREPGSRDSDYFGTKDAAQLFLDHLLKQRPEVAAQFLRTHP